MEYMNCRAWKLPKLETSTSLEWQLLLFKLENLHQRLVTLMTSLKVEIKSFGRFFTKAARAEIQRTLFFLALASFDPVLGVPKKLDLNNE